MSPETLDQVLVEAAQSGSTAAFARLVERHQQALRLPAAHERELGAGR